MDSKEKTCEKKPNRRREEGEESEQHLDHPLTWMSERRSSDAAILTSGEQECDRKLT